MNNKIRSLLNTVSSKRRLKIILFVALLVASGVAVWRFNSLFPTSVEPDTEVIVSIPADEALQTLATALNKPVDSLFAPGLPVLQNALFVNTRKKELVCSTVHNSEFIMHYETAGGSQKVANGSEGDFDTFITRLFPKIAYQQHVNDNTPLDGDDLKKLLTSPDAANQVMVKLATVAEIRTQLMTLIYNVVLSGSNGHFVTIVEDSKLKSLKAADYRLDVIDKDKLGSVIGDIRGNAVNEKAKFIENEYANLHHPSRKKTDDAGGSLQDNITKLLGPGTIWLNNTSRYHLAYVNFKKDILYIGDDSIPYRPTDLFAGEESALPGFFKRNFSLENIKNNSNPDEADLKRIAGSINVTDSFVNLVPGKSAYQLLFNAVLKYLLANPSSYVIVDNRFMAPDPHLLVGRFDTAILGSGMGILENGGLTDTMEIIRKDRTAWISMVGVVLLLLVVCGILLFYPAVVHAQGTATTTTTTTVPVENKEEEKEGKKEETTLPPAPIDVKAVVKRDEIRQKTIKEVISYIDNGKGYFENKDLEVIQKQVNFYKKMEAANDTTSLVKLIEAENQKNFRINLPTVKKLFDEVDREKEVADKINLLLKKYDDYSSNIPGSNTNLTKEYDKLDSYKKKYEVLSKMLVDDEMVTDFYEYLRAEIEKTRKNPGVAELLQFASLFKVFPEKTGNQAKALNEQHLQSSKAIDEFLSKIKPVDKPNLLDRVAFVYGATELAVTLAGLKNKSIGGIKSRKILEEQLQLVFNRQFVGVAQNEQKTTDDLELALEDAKRSIHTNETLGLFDEQVTKNGVDSTEHIDSLRKFMQKIKRFDKTDLFFTKMHERFVKNFIDNIDDLKLTTRDSLENNRDWFFQGLFNIAFHAADYIDHFKRNDQESYHFNVQLLFSDLNINAVQRRDFIEDDSEKSSPSSNFVAKLARDAGVKQLDILVNKFYISPEHLNK